MYLGQASAILRSSFSMSLTVNPHRKPRPIKIETGLIASPFGDERNIVPSLTKACCKSFRKLLMREREKKSRKEKNQVRKKKNWVQTLFCLLLNIFTGLIMANEVISACRAGIRLWRWGMPEEHLSLWLGINLFVKAVQTANFGRYFWPQFFQGTHENRRSFNLNTLKSNSVFQFLKNVLGF